MHKKSYSTFSFSRKGLFFLIFLFFFILFPKNVDAATLGLTSIDNPDGISGLYRDIINCSGYLTGTHSGTITDINAYMVEVNGTSNVRYALYSGDDDEPLDLLWQSDPTPLTPADAHDWFTLETGGVEFTSNSSIWICENSDGDNGQFVTVDTQSLIAEVAPFTFGTFPQTPNNWRLPNPNVQYVMYANYISNETTFTLFPVADSYIKEGSSNENEGRSTFFRLQSTGHNRGLITFDESEIEDAVGNSQDYTAALKLTISDNGNNWGASGRTIGVHRFLQNWTEGNGFIVGNSPSDRGTGLGTTWNCAIDTNIHNTNDDCTGLTSWNMSNSALWPFVSTATTTTTITNNQSGVVSFDVTDDIESFINGTNNYGWLIKKTNESQNGRIEFGSRESIVSPELIINRN